MGKGRAKRVETIRATRTAQDSGAGGPPVTIQLLYCVGQIFRLEFRTIPGKIGRLVGRFLLHPKS
jgi:hypothetical protein